MPNTSDDTHLGTGTYDPETYWDARADQNCGNSFRTVCLFKATDDENRAVHRVHAAAMNSVVKRLALKGREVLEYGCGSGRWIPWYTKIAASWHGVDISDKMLALAKITYPQADVQKVSSGGAVPFASRSMDFVYSVTVMHHNPYDRQERIADELARVVKVGGHVLIIEDVGETAGSFNMFPRPESSWAALFRKRGFVVTHQSGLSYLPLKRLAERLTELREAPRF